MLRRTFLATALAAGVALPARAAQLAYVLDTEDGFLNLRAGPGGSTAIRLRLTAGTELAVFGASGDWLSVGLPDGTDGWVHGDYVAANYAPARRYDFAVMRTSDGYLNLRSGPGTGYRILRRLHAGQRLFALDRSGSWILVQLPEGTTGWTSGNFLAPSR